MTLPLPTTLVLLLCCTAAKPPTSFPPPAPRQPIAGIYSGNEGMWIQVSLYLSESGLFTCHWSGCRGPVTTSLGTWTHTRNRITFHTTRSTNALGDPEPIQLTQATLISNGPTSGVVVVLDEHLEAFRRPYSLNKGLRREPRP